MNVRKACMRSTYRLHIGSVPTDSYFAGLPAAAPVADDVVENTDLDLVPEPPNFKRGLTLKFGLQTPSLAHVCAVIAAKRPGRGTRGLSDDNRVSSSPSEAWDAVCQPKGSRDDYPRVWGCGGVVLWCGDRSGRP